MFFASPKIKPAASQGLVGSQVMSSGLVVVLLSMLLGIQPVTTDLYLPALPALTDSFGASTSQAQLTLSALLLAFGCSQLVWGPLSDRFGRRPILLCGLAAYVVASIGGVLAPSMTMLIGWRALQGAAMGAAVMAARAIVRDLYLPADGARMMSKGASGLGVLASISAPVGALLAESFGWRATLMAVTIFGACALMLVALRFKETIPLKNPRALYPAHQLGTWRQILTNPTFLAFSALTGASYAGLFTFLASSSFVFIEVLGLSRLQYGLVMFCMCFSYLIGTFICRRLLVRFGVRKTVALAAGMTLLGGTLMGALAWAGVTHMWAVILPFYLYMLGHGVHQPCGQSGAVGPFPHAAGAASALNGFLMMVVAFGMGGWLGSRMDGTVLPLANGVWFWSLCVALSAWTLVRRYGEPATAALQPSAA